MLRKFLVAATALALSTGAAHAAIYDGTATFADTDSSTNAVNFSAPSVNFSTHSLTAGQTQTINDFFTITESDKSTRSSTDSLTASLSFTQPSAATGGTTGSGSGSLTDLGFFGTYINGTISWNNPITVDFTDGAELEISLATVSDDGTYGTTQTLDDAATFKVIKDPTPTPVPEPGSLVLLATGLLGLGTVLRRRRAG